MTDSTLAYNLTLDELEFLQAVERWPRESNPPGADTPGPRDVKPLPRHRPDGVATALLRARRGIDRPHAGRVRKLLEGHPPTAGRRLSTTIARWGILEANAWLAPCVGAGSLHSARGLSASTGSPFFAATGVRLRRYTSIPDEDVDAANVLVAVDEPESLRAIQPLPRCVEILDSERALLKKHALQKKARTP